MDDNKQQPLTEEELKELTDLTQPDQLDFKPSQEPKRPSFWSKVKSTAIHRAKRLVVRELAGAAEVPGLNIGLAAYEAYQFGKDIRHFIREEQAIAAMLKKKEEIAFYKKKELERSFELGSIQRNLKRINTDIEELKEKTKHFVTITDSWEHVVDHKLLRQKNANEFKLEKLNKRSIEEQISKIHADPAMKLATQKNLEKAEQTAIQFEKNKLIGTAGEKHQYLLTYATKRLGKEYFNPVTHPERITRFHKFSSQRLYHDGFENHEIASALSHDPFLKGLEKDHPYIKEVLESIRSPHNTGQKIQDWRIENGISLYDKRTPDEYRLAQKLTEREAKVTAEKWVDIKFSEAKAARDKYNAQFQKGTDTKLTTKEEYMVELGRNLALGNYHNQDSYIAQKLALVGHKESDIIKALNEASPYASGKDYGQVQFIEARRFLISKEGQEMRQLVEQYKQIHPHLQNETRLNRFGFHTREESIIYEHKEPRLNSHERTVDFLHPGERGR